VTIAAEKYAIHAGRKTVKPEDIAIAVKDMGINVQIPQKTKPKVRRVAAVVADTHVEPVQTPVKTIPAGVVPKVEVPQMTPVQKPVVSPPPIPPASSVQATLKAQAQLIKNI
jgi:hypothetical protein